VPPRFRLVLLPDCHSRPDPKRHAPTRRPDGPRDVAAGYRLRFLKGSPDWATHRCFLPRAVRFPPHYSRALAVRCAGPSAERPGRAGRPTGCQKSTLIFCTCCKSEQESPLGRASRTTPSSRGKPSKNHKLLCLHRHLNAKLTKGQLNFREVTDCTPVAPVFPPT
jgi:hypothetical protein